MGVLSDLDVTLFDGTAAVDCPRHTPAAASRIGATRTGNRRRDWMLGNLRVSIVSQQPGSLYAGNSTVRATSTAGCVFNSPSTDSGTRSSVSTRAIA